MSEGRVRQAQDLNSPEFIFSQIQDFSSILKDLSLNTSVKTGGINNNGKRSVSLSGEQSQNSSLGLLPPETLEEGQTTFSWPGPQNLSQGHQNVSLGRYLQPACLIPSEVDSVEVSNRKASDSEEDEGSSPVPLLQREPQHLDMQRLQPSLMEVFRSPSAEMFNVSEGFPWEKIIRGEAGAATTLNNLTSLHQASSSDLPSMNESWRQDPSFCSGKISARSTSFGATLSQGNSTRDENFSDFSKPPSFQGSYLSSHNQDSILHSGVYTAPSLNPFSGVVEDGQVELQAQFSQEFSDNEFSPAFGVMEFLAQEEEECLKEHQFFEEDQMSTQSGDSQVNSSAFSGVSDKSIVLRNSNLWCGDTSGVDLRQLRREETILTTKISRCEYFRHNSSRLGSLDEMVPEDERPGLGFVHHIRSPERQPCPLLSRRSLLEVESSSSEEGMSDTFRLQQNKGRRESDGSGSSGSAPNSANTTYMPSGDSTKTVISLMDQSGTLKASDLASRLEALAEQLGGQGGNKSEAHMDALEQSLDVDRLEVSIQKTFDDAGPEINLSAISKVLSEASVSSDPQHFVNVILGCLKKRQGEDYQAGGLEKEEKNEDLPISAGAGSERLTSPHQENQPSKKEGTDFGGGGGSGEGVLGTDIPACDAQNPHQSVSDTSWASKRLTTPSPQMNSSVSRRAMMRLAPSPAETLPRVRRSFGVSKPIKPFSSKNHVSGQVQPVAPVRPQQTEAYSLPSSARTTPSPPAVPLVPLVKSTSLPCSLDLSNRQRRPSGARHSSPKKKSVTIKSPHRDLNLDSPSSLSTTPHMTDLSRLLDVASTHTPTLHLSSASHLTTSTPFHPGMNLSTVILDNLTHNHSLSPLVNPDTAINSVSLDVSTVTPALYTSLMATSATHCTPTHEQEHNLPPISLVELLPDWSLPEVLCSHVRHQVQVPVTTQHMAGPTSLVLKVTGLWVNSTPVPTPYWDQLIECPVEQLVSLHSEQEQHLDLVLTVKKGGLLTLNLGLMLDNGTSSAGLVRLQVEEPNIQVLTENGVRVEFGNLAEDCSHSVPLVLVNCGRSTVPLVLELREPNDLFSLEGGLKMLEFSIPGVQGGSLTPGQGVAKETSVSVTSVGLTVSQTRVFQTELSLHLGSPSSDLTLLGCLSTVVRVGLARLRIKKSQEPVVFSCLPGETVSQQVQLLNSGQVPLTLSLEVDTTPQGQFSYDRQVIIAPDSELQLLVSFTCQPLATPGPGPHTLYLTVSPGGPRHLVSLQTNVRDSSTETFRTSQPAISFGVIRKVEAEETQLSNTEQIPTVFPIESDRSHVNFINVPLGGGGEEQVLTLRNSTPAPVFLTLIIRESEEFSIAGPSGPVSTSQCLLDPNDTKNISVVFCPRKPGCVRGKLVLKPQGRKLDGKSFKATISLLGLPGHADIKMSGENLLQLKPACHQLVCSQPPTTTSVHFNNQGEAAGFVKIVASEETDRRLEVNPEEFILGPGQERQVLVTVCLELQNQLVLSVFTGPELCRQVMRRARSIPGAARLGDNPALLGVDFSHHIPGEQSEQVPSQLTALDVLHFYQKTVKTLLSVTPWGHGGKQAEFQGLAVEETLSETRIDQSIALPLFSTHQVVTKTRAPVHSPPSREEGDQLVLQPRHLSLARGGEGAVKLINRQARTVHWDLAWPAQHLDISPTSGPLSPGGQVVLCLAALSSPSVPGAWRGQVSVYSDDEVVTLDVTITPAPLTSPPACLSVSSRRVDLGTTVLGGTNTGAIRVANPGQLLVQWKAVVEPSFFSLPQPGGLLNPGQAVSLAIHFKPAAPGPHNSSLSLHCAPVRGGQEPSASSPPLVVTLTGKAVSVKEAASFLPSGPKVAVKKALVATSGGKKGGNSGTVSLETDLVVFKDTQLGEGSVAKVKIKNRCGNDQTVEIIPLESNTQEGPQFKTVHSVIEVKNQCFCTVPVQFRPTFRGVHNQLISFRWEGSKIITANLRGNCV